MRALIWVGIAIVALGALAYAVFRIAVGFAVTLFVVGVAVMIWGAVKAKRAL
ncbi:MAG TPA: hypothetical protein VMM18_02520 [Gemmatimonadaceae bacterium]|nr:hypothetical protein [Gemmatimonadaceae bacterium]